MLDETFAHSMLNSARHTDKVTSAAKDDDDVDEEDRSLIPNRLSLAGLKLDSGKRLGSAHSATNEGSSTHGTVVDNTDHDSNCLSSSDSQSLASPPRHQRAKRANPSTLENTDKVRPHLSFDTGNRRRSFAESATVIRKRLSNMKESIFSSKSTYFDGHRYLRHFPSIYLLSLEEFIAFLSQHLSKPISPVEKMFPWLHGIHKNNYAQLQFLGACGCEDPKIERNNGEKDTETESSALPSPYKSATPLVSQSVPTGVRNMMVIRACNSEGEVSSEYTNIITESTGLVRGTVSADDILETSRGIADLEVYLQSLMNKYDIKLPVSVDTIIDDCLLTRLLPIFKDMDPQFGVSLRNFHIQVSKMSNVSDLVVYCFNADHERCVDEAASPRPSCFDFSTGRCKCVSLCRLLRIAQLIYANQHPEVRTEDDIGMKGNFSSPNSTVYHTFLIETLDEKRLERSNLLAIPVMDEQSDSKAPEDLCSLYDLNVFNNWDSNYLYRERLEISKMSTATPISTSHIWLGNITDFECLQIRLSNGRPMTDTKYKTTRIPLHCDPANTDVTLTKSDLDSSKLTMEDLGTKLITLPKARWRLFIHCFEGAGFPGLDDLKLLVEGDTANERISVDSDDSETLSTKATESVLDFPPSGSMTLTDLSEEKILTIINICKMCYEYCDKDYQALFYCSDGYTETSLLAICFIMYAEHLSLDDALIKLHCDYGRPFFIFKSDYSLLDKLESVLLEFSPLNPEKKYTPTDRAHFKFEEDPSSIEAILLKPRSHQQGFGSSNRVGGSGNSRFGRRTLQSTRPLFNGRSYNGASFAPNAGTHIHLRDRAGRAGRIPSRSVGTSRVGYVASSVGTRPARRIPGKVGVTNPQQYSTSASTGSSPSSSMGFHATPSSFFAVPRPLSPLEPVMGSLPSRILPYLYLGSLVHASCLSMLSSLKIDYLVSVGEYVPWLRNLDHTLEKTKSGCELITIEPDQVDAESGNPCHVKKLIRLGNINDDGVGTLITKLDDALEFIDQSKANGGKVLVHCQVGVSRSATVCIAEVVKSLNVSLPRAYMYVRVRRLNVIIQPNLKLMYELFKWEEALVKLKRKKKEVSLISNTPEFLREVDWCIFCREIFNLNRAYVKSSY